MVAGERKQVILRDAVAARRYDDGGEKQARAAASRLHMDGYLARDPKDGSVWYPTDKALAETQALVALEDGGEGSADASGLVETVRRARALLDEGDVLNARIVASVAYRQAKTAAQFAEMVGAGERLIAKARRMQADALLVETRAKILITEKWDEAREAGEVSKGGRPKPVSDGNGLTAAETGLSRKEIHEARKLGEAERRDPGVLERVVEARVSSGLEPTRASLKAQIGTKTATKEERGDNLYETAIEAMRVLLALESFSAMVLEPACGRGAISRPLEAAGYAVVLSDLNDYGTADRHGECQQVGDFLLSEPVPGADIVTNPPYGAVLNAFMAHALRVHKPEKMALLLNVNAFFGTEDDDRNDAMGVFPPSRVYCFARRLPMMHRDGWDGPVASSSMNTAWFVWERNADGSYGRKSRPWSDDAPDGPVFYRIDWKDFAGAEALAPGGGACAAPPLIFRAMPPDDEDEFRRETPRVPDAERVEAVRAQALVWMAERETFDAVALRRALTIRPLIAAEILATFEREGLVAPVSDGTFALTDKAMAALAATAGALSAGMTAADIDEFSRGVA